MASNLESASFQKIVIKKFFFAIPDFSNMAELFPYLPNMVEKIPLTQWLGFARVEACRGVYDSQLR